FWLGITIVVLMGIAYVVSTTGLGALMVAPAVFAFGLVAFGFLGMGPVTIAVDSYGPVTDNAQSVFELSVIETMPGVAEQIRRDYGFTVSFDRAKHLLEENDGAGNTFKATAKPVLIGTAVVGATNMIFSIIVVLTAGLTQNLDKLSLLHPPFLLGLITGGAVIYWLKGASTHAVSTGPYRAVQFLKANSRLEGTTKDTSLVAMYLLIKFTTFFALLSVELGVTLTAKRGAAFSGVLAAICFGLLLIFVWRSFYAMRIQLEARVAAAAVSPAARGK